MWVERGWKMNIIIKGNLRLHNHDVHNTLSGHVIVAITDAVVR